MGVVRNHQVSANEIHSEIQPHSSQMAEIIKDKKRMLERVRDVHTKKKGDQCVSEITNSHANYTCMLVPVVKI